MDHSDDYEFLYNDSLPLVMKRFGNIETYV